MIKPIKPVVFIIRDGWGINPQGFFSKKKDGNASLLAKTPFHDALYATYPMSHVSASGLDVGLPDGQMGNSEVGHMNLGAGRIVYQDLTRINKTISENRLSENENIRNFFQKIKANRTRLHLIGLVSDGGVHSHQEHLLALCSEAKKAGLAEILVHALTDGRDTSPTGGSNYLKYCDKLLKKIGAKIATVIGRYYAMDRDRRWDRTKLAWDAIVSGIGQKCSLPAWQMLQEFYEKGVTDEFLPALIFEEFEQQRINDGDGIIFFNFRADRARQLSLAFLNKDFSKFERSTWPQIEYATMTEYDKNYDCLSLFRPQIYKNSLGEIVSQAGLKQLRIAETEKYPHVTYFFNIGVEKPYLKEDRKIIPSPKVATYDLKPEMSAQEVTQDACKLLDNYHLMILNFANPDMVGHTGSVEAAIKAVQIVDKGVKKVVERTLELGGKLLISADHGNCEFMRNADGSPHTAHTTNLVHLLYVGNDHEKIGLKNGILADIAPTLLEILKLEKPAEMTGQSLIYKK